MSLLQDTEQKNKNNTHWFKKLFLGLMGSVALTKAVDSYFRDILKFNTVGNISGFWSRITHVLSEPHRLAFHLVSLLLVLFFLANLVRYYMSIFIYEHFTSEVWSESGSIAKRYSMLSNKNLKALVEAELEKNEVFKRRKYQKIYSTIIDLVLSLCIFFLLGTAGYSIANINGFSLCMIFILTADLVQILYQRWSYFPKKKRLYVEYKKELIKILRNNTLLAANGITLQNDELLNLIAELDKTYTDTHTDTLKNWFWVDVREFCIWVLVIAIEICFVQGNVMCYWFQLIPVALIFLSYYYDIRANREAWADMFDIEIK